MRLASLLMGGAGAYIGVLVSAVVGAVWLLREQNGVGRVIQLGFLTGIVGGGLSVPVIFLCGPSVHPVVSSSALWAAVGWIAGLGGYYSSLREDTPSARQSRFRPRDALLWAFAAGGCVGLSWAGVFVVAKVVGGPTFVPDYLPEGAVGLALLHAALGAAEGLFVGVLVGYARGRDRPLPSTLGLSLGGMLFGALGGGLSVVVGVATRARMDPILSPALVWSAIGFIMGLAGYYWSHRSIKPDEPTDEEEFALPRPARIEWVLRERMRAWAERPIGRVLPVLLVSAASLTGAAACAPADLSLGLLAVGLLGLAVARVLYNQETRLRRLEQRWGGWK